MTKQFSLVIAALALTAAVSAQSPSKTMYLWKNGAIIHQEFVSAIDSVTFYAPEAPEPECPTEEVGVVVNGVRWATRNLDVGGVFVTCPEDYGALYQWGRVADGHESRDSENHPTNNNDPESGPVSILTPNGQVPTNIAGYGKFIKNNNSAMNSWNNWHVGALNYTLWNSGSELAPTKTVNDPCPNGWRVPTAAELQSLKSASGAWTELNGVGGYLFEGVLFLPAAGHRHYAYGSFSFIDERGFYWSSEASNNPPFVQGLSFVNGSIQVYNFYQRAFGFCVRCVADE